MVAMPKSEWKAILSRKQLEYLPLITGCLFAMMIITTLRDILYTRGATTEWFYVVEYATASIVLVIWIGAILKLIPAQHAQNVTLLSTLCIGLKAGIAVAFWEFEGPGNLMITLFATGLVMLSLPHVIVTQIIIFLCWLLPALSVFSLSEILPTASIGIIGGGLGFVVVYRRIDTFREILELENRVIALESILPMCAGCKKTRDENGNWRSVESYIESHDEGTIISHGLCPGCKEANYGDFLRKHEKTQTM